MHHPLPWPGDWPPPSYDAQANAVAMARQARDIVAVAHGLLDGGRRVDLTGLDRSVGLLCAKMLDLPPEQGRAGRIELLHLLTAIDLLTVAMRIPPV